MARSSTSWSAAGAGSASHDSTAERIPPRWKLRPARTGVRDVGSRVTVATTGPTETRSPKAAATSTGRAGGARGGGGAHRREDAHRDARGTGRGARRRSRRRRRRRARRATRRARRGRSPRPRRRPRGRGRATSRPGPRGRPRRGAPRGRRPRGARRRPRSRARRRSARARARGDVDGEPAGGAAAEGRARVSVRRATRRRAVAPTTSAEAPLPCAGSSVAASEVGSGSGPGVTRGRARIEGILQGCSNDSAGASTRVDPGRGAA